MKNYLLEAADYLFERLRGSPISDEEAFEAWLKTYAIPKDDYYLYRPYGNYPYSKESLRKIFNENKKNQ